MPLPNGYLVVSAIAMGEGENLREERPSTPPRSRVAAARRLLDGLPALVRSDARRNTEAPGRLAVVPGAVTAGLVRAGQSATDLRSDFARSLTAWSLACLEIRSCAVTTPSLA